MMFGSLDSQLELLVNREGEINFPEIGNIGIAGMTFEAASEHIKNRISKQMIGGYGRSTAAYRPQPAIHTCSLRMFHSPHAQDALFTTVQCISQPQPTAPGQNSGRPMELPLGQAWSRTSVQELFHPPQAPSSSLTLNFILESTWG